MGDLVVYDKVSWHYPEGTNCLSLSEAKVHFEVVMNWLANKELLSEEGKELFELGVDGEFSITSAMLTDTGMNLLDNLYSVWLDSFSNSEDIKLTILEEGLRRYRNDL